MAGDFDSVRVRRAGDMTRGEPVQKIVFQSAKQGDDSDLMMRNA